MLLQCPFFHDTLKLCFTFSHVRADVDDAAAALLSSGETGMSLVEKRLIPSLDKVGTDYESGKLFLPQLLGAAQAAQVVFEVVRASMSGETPVEKGKLVIATVKGDIHDIGKNIVKTVLENYGYKVIDLGRDVPPQKVADAVLSNHVKLVGLSALMTTTLPSMLSYQCSYYTEDYNIMYGFGGLELMTYNYTDAEWAE